MSTASLLQRTPAWHAARKGKLTASNVGAALGLCPWTSRQQAYNRALGLERFTGKAFNDAIGHVPFSQLRIRPLLYTGNDATRWGTKNESNGILAYTAHTGNIVEATGLHVHKATEWLAGSPDGLVGTEGMLEVKCPFWRKKDGSRVHKSVPDHYYMQIQLCLEICERKWCDFISWTPEGFAIYRVTRDEELHELMMPHYVNFFAAMQRCAVQPPGITSDEKEKIVASVTASMQANIDYEFWKNVDPDATPPSPASPESPTLKRQKLENNGALATGRDFPAEEQTCL